LKMELKKRGGGGKGVSSDVQEGSLVHGEGDVRADSVGRSGIGLEVGQ